jgi:hypothetical protein
MLAVAWGIVLLWFREADYDIFHQLAVGAHWLQTGTVQDREVFSFQPTLPLVINHEWGTGILSVLILKAAGSGGLLLWKALLGILALAAPLWLARRAGAPHGALLLLAPVAALGVLPGYVPAVRAHVMTYTGFALLLALVEVTRRTRAWWPVPVAAALMLVWANCHGGFVAGFGLVGVFALGSWKDRAAFLRLAVMGVACMLVTLANPWGFGYWPHHLMALGHKRPMIGEWAAIEPFALDVFTGYRLLVPVTVAVIAWGWKRVPAHDWPMLAMLVLTLALPFSARRHAPFSAVMALPAMAPYLAVLWAAHGRRLEARGLPLRAIGTGACAALCIAAAVLLGPGIRFSIRAPMGLFPVREADLLDRSGLSGNLANPFGWGCYLMWRLHPRIKVSIDGRYEAAYPEESFLANQLFHSHAGPGWDRLLKEHTVDFVILDLQGAALRPGHLAAYGFRTVFEDEGTSALLVHERRLAEFTAAMDGVSLETLPTQDPFDLAIAERWRPAP